MNDIEEIERGKILAMILGIVIGWLFVRLILDAVQKHRMDEVRFARAVVSLKVEADDAQTVSILNECISNTAKRDGVSKWRTGGYEWTTPQKPTPPEVGSVDKSKTNDPIV